MKPTSLRPALFILLFLCSLLIPAFKAAQRKAHPTWRFVVQMKDGTGARYDCYLTADDEKSEKIGAPGSNYEDGDYARTGHYHIGLRKKGWAAPKVQHVSLFDAATRGIGEFNLKRRMVYTLSGSGASQPDILVVEQYATSTHNTRRFYFVQNHTLVSLLCKLPGKQPSADNYLPGREIKSAGPWRFKTLSQIDANDVSDADQIGTYEDIWRFSPSQRLLIREARYKVP